MKLTAKPSAEALVACWREMAELICASRFEELAAKFGYGVRHDREAVAAIREDVAFCLRTIGESQVPLPSFSEAPKVTFYAPSDLKLVASVDGTLLVKEESFMGFGLVVFGEDGDYYVSLESVEVTVAKHSLERTRRV